MLWIGIVSVILIFIRRIFYDWLKSWGYTISSKQIEVDENLPNFFNAVKVKHARWLVMESNYLKEEFGFTFSDQNVIDRLEDITAPKRPIQTKAWYNILANPVYSDEFSYISVCVKNREEYIEDDDSDDGNNREQSDMVSILMNLAYNEKSHDLIRKAKLE